MKSKSKSKAEGVRPAESSGEATDGSPKTVTPTNATVADREQAVLDNYAGKNLDTEAARGTSG